MGVHIPSFLNAKIAHSRTTITYCKSMSCTDVTVSSIYRGPNKVHVWQICELFDQKIEYQYFNLPCLWNSSSLYVKLYCSACNVTKYYNTGLTLFYSLAESGDFHHHHPHFSIQLEYHLMFEGVMYCMAQSLPICQYIMRCRKSFTKVDEFWQ